MKGGVAGDDEKRTELGKLGDDILGDAVGEELLIRIGAHVDEGKHGKRRLVGQLERRCVDPRGGFTESRRSRGRSRPINSYRPIHVLHPLLAQVFQVEVELAAQRLVGGAGETETARLGEPFQSGRHIDAIAVEVLPLDDHVTQIDTDTKDDPSLGRDVPVALDHALLYRQSAGHGVDDTGEFDQGAVAHELHDAPPLGRDRGVD